MAEDYLQYWSITKAPFSLTPDPDMLYLSSQHSECLMRLKYAIFSQKGGALLVSDNAGNGKTSILGRLKNDLDDYYGGKVRVVFIDHPTLAPIEMIGEISRQLGGELHTDEKIRALNGLRDRLYELYNENIKVVVIVDEGQMLKERPDILGELRILLNFCVADAFLLTFIFSGQKPLDSVLRDMPEFWQRLPVRFFLRNLDFNDTRGLIRFRLQQVGASTDIFTEDAYEGIYNYSDGCPRVACAVADLCLVIGYSKGVRRIGFVEVSTACRDMDSSGDGYHYYAFMKSQDMALDSGRASNPARSKKPHPEAASSAKRENAGTLDMQEQRPHVSLADSINCPFCGEANAKERRFCTNCDKPLYRKCHGCGSLFDTISNECPHCGADIEKAKAETVNQARDDLRPFDIMENSYATWLGALGYSLEQGEEMLIAFPRGNMITPGPTIKEGSARSSEKAQPCDLILSDRRLIIGRNNGDTTAVDLARIDTCTISSSGMLITRKTVLILGFDGKIYRLALPWSSGKNREIFDILSTYIRSEMLK